MGAIGAIGAMGAMGATPAGDPIGATDCAGLPIIGAIGAIGATGAGEDVGTDCFLDKTGEETCIGEAGTGVN